MKKSFVCFAQKQTAWFYSDQSVLTEFTHSKYKEENMYETIQKSKNGKKTIISNSQGTEESKSSKNNTTYIYCM